MALYRGAGGAGDATADSISEASLIKQLAVEVQADADAAEAARAAAVAAKVAAETAETNAETAETNAETAETNAETAASNASSSASAASTSATNAASSATAASGSATNAASSATSASSSASSASTSATNASNSASAAATSATNASNSATAAASSASTASTQASNAASSASAASTSATAAASSATSAASSATTATTQAGIATTQATNAATSATAAQTAETNAETAETNAAASASAAATSATNASNSASAASTSATNASNSASAAATSATNAANSATSAAASATSAANSAASINPSSIAITGGSINGTTVGATTPASGSFTTLSASGAFTANGGVTLGDASGDALTINSSAVSIPNGLNFDSNTFVIDAGNNRVGVGIASPTVALDVNGALRVGVASNPTTIANNSQFYDQSLVGPTISGYNFSVRTGNPTPTEVFRITDAGNVGIGTSSPSSFGSNFKILELQAGSSSGGGGYYLTGNGTATAQMGVDGTTGYIGMRSNHPVAFTTNNTERMRIDNSGNLLVGTTSVQQSSQLTVAGYIATNGITSHAGTGGAYGTNRFNLQWTGSPALWVDTTNIGNIQLSSDYRIKRNIQTQTTPALERVMALRPVTYQMADYGTLFKASEDIKEGFIAHEVQDVIPSGADGIKDAENQIQSLRVDAILAVAVKAIQELKAELDTVKAEVTALKGTA